jgi:hypothetical protein
MHLYVTWENSLLLHNSKTFCIISQNISLWTPHNADDILIKWSHFESHTLFIAIPDELSVILEV